MKTNRYLAALALSLFGIGCTDSPAADWEAPDDFYEKRASFDLSLDEDGGGDYQESLRVCFDGTEVEDTLLVLSGEVEWEEGEESGEYNLTFDCKRSSGSCFDGLQVECGPTVHAACEMSEDGETLTCIEKNPEEPDDYNLWLWLRASD